MIAVIAKKGFPPASGTGDFQRQTATRAGFPVFLDGSSAFWATQGA